MVSAPNGQGIVTEANGSQTGNGNNNNDDSNSLPMGMSQQMGSNNGMGGTPGMNCAPDLDCSDSLLAQWNLGQGDPNDKIWWSFKTKTPTGTKAYAIDFAFFSSEWPVYVDTTFNDLFVAWEVSEAYVGSISVIDNLSTTITALHPHWSSQPIGFPKSCANFGSDGPGYSCAEPQLQGTGYSNHAATAWVRINQPIEEAKDLELFFFLA
ncbi:MAG: hypothetical protein KC457_35725, partial [Myxococcales bacterium]|nr:hypothetical protein [Myxococcales bacterium]